MPTKVFLAKGEKRQFVFWTDQDYSQTTTTQSSTSPDDSEDPFLEFINNNKPTTAENEIEITFQQFPAVPPVPAVRPDLPIPPVPRWQLVGSKSGKNFLIPM